MSFSVNTNASSLSALLALQNTQRQMQGNQTAINTGLKIATAKDNAAIFSIAQNLRADISGYKAVMDSVNRGTGTVDVALAAGQFVSDLLIDLKEKAIMFKDASSTEERTAILTDYNAILKQINSIVDNAEFNGVNLLKGTKGSFQNPVLAANGIRSGTLPNNQNVGDLNNDGLEDLTDSKNIYLSNGDGTFSKKLILGGAQPVDILDINKDGYNDIITEAGYQLGDGTGNLTGTTPLAGSSMNFGGGADFNLDGNVDILSIDDNGSGYRIYDGSTSWANTIDTIARPSTLTARETGVQIMDLNNDSFDDFIIEGTINNPLNDSLFVSYLNNGDGTFTKSQENIVVDGGTIADSNIKDFNNDGILDYIFQGKESTSNSTIYYYAGNGDGTFSAPVIIDNVTSLSFPMRTLDSGDFNADGNQDLVYADGANIVVKNGNGDGTFATAGVIATTTDIAPSKSIEYVRSIDIDGDNRKDIIFGSTSGSNLFSIRNASAKKFSIITNPAGSNKFEFNSEPMTLTALSLDNLSITADPTNVINKISSAIDAVSLKLGRLGSAAKILENLGSFTQKISSGLEIGVGNLVDADMGKESATLQAMQVKEQLGLQALGIANQSKKLILNLFGKGLS